MGSRESRVTLVQVTPEEMLAAGLAQRAVAAAAEALGASVVATVLGPAPLAQ